MAFFWRSFASRITVGGTSHDEIALASLGIGERLERVILQGWIDVATDSSATADEWVKQGVLSLIEVTKGNPPPAPDRINLGGFDTRDIVFSQYHQLGNPQILVSRFSAPEPPGMIDIDVETRRGDGIDPITVWWVWGIPFTSGAGIQVGFWRLWTRLLIEQI